MKTRFKNILMLSTAVIIFFIASLLMGRLGIYVDEYGTSPSVVWGSPFWNYMNWLVWLFLGMNVAYWLIKVVLHKEA